MLLKKTQNNDFFGAAPRGGRGNLSFYKLFPNAPKLNSAEFTEISFVKKDPYSGDAGKDIILLEEW